jgi:hypothetical protein
MTTAVRILTSKTRSDKNYKLPPSVGEGIPIMTDNQSSMSDSEANVGTVECGLGESSKNKRDSIDSAFPALTHISESNQSLEEVFGTHFDDSAKSPTTQDSLNIKSPANDEWFNGDADLMSKDDRDDGQLLFTGPISLYMPSDGYLSSTCLDGKSGNQSLDSYGKNAASESVTTSANGSLSSRGSTPSNSIPRPLLYSAIGSLENPNPTSLGSLSKRLAAVVGKSSLLPPATTYTSLAGTTLRSSMISPDSERKTDKWPFASSDRNTLPSDKALTGPQDNTNSARSQRGKKEKGQEEIKKRNGDSSKGGEVRGTENPVGNKVQKSSNLRRSSKSGKNDNGKSVSYDRKSLQSKKQVEMFRPSCDAYTPRIGKKSLKYKTAEKRTPVQTMGTTMGTLQRPNFRDALRRVAMIMHQHIVKIERRFEQTHLINRDRGLFTTQMRDAFSEETFCTPTYKCTMVRIPMARPGMVFGLRQIKTKPMIPTEKEIYEFAHQLFKSVQLSSECSIVCLIYVERLMEVAKVPLLACTWRPIFMCGLLLASKVWQDLSSWNIEFASVYPQFSLDAINKLEVNFLKYIKWDLYISSR